MKRKDLKSALYTVITLLFFACGTTETNSKNKSNDSASNAITESTKDVTKVNNIVPIPVADVPQTNIDIIDANNISGLNASNGFTLKNTGHSSILSTLGIGTDNPSAKKFYSLRVYPALTPTPNSKMDLIILGEESDNLENPSKMTTITSKYYRLQSNNSGGALILIEDPTAKANAIKDIKRFVNTFVVPGRFKDTSYRINIGKYGLMIGTLQSHSIIGIRFSPAYNAATKRFYLVGRGEKINNVIVSGDNNYFDQMHTCPEKCPENPLNR